MSLTIPLTAAISTRNRKSSDEYVGNLHMNSSHHHQDISNDDCIVHLPMEEIPNDDNQKDRKSSKGSSRSNNLLSTILSPIHNRIKSSGTGNNVIQHTNNTSRKLSSPSRPTISQRDQQQSATLSSNATSPSTLHNQINNNDKDEVLHDNPQKCSSTTSTFTEYTSLLTSFIRTKIGFLSKSKCDGKKIVSTIMTFALLLLTFDALFSSPENRIFKPDFSDKFLLWVQRNPTDGIVWIIIFMALAVIFMIPIGTPITVGCGFVYKGTYGWKIGVTIATIVSMAGSAVGAVICFLLGRYLMREQVRKWIRKYPLFDAIDIASAEHGLRIMAMLYLTPILPLGPISYMCGTTSMKLSSFILAKVAALPLMTLYVFIGASAGALVGTSTIKDTNTTSGMELMPDEVPKFEENVTFIVAGILLSFVMIAFITHSIKKELNKILDRQQKLKPGEENDRGDGSTDIEAVNSSSNSMIPNISDNTTKISSSTIEMNGTNSNNNNNNAVSSNIINSAAATRQRKH